MSSKKMIMEHVLYEIQMYQQTLFLLTFKKYDIEEEKTYSGIIKNSLYESHMMHLRNVFLFFRNSKKLNLQDDIIYKDVIVKEDDKFNLLNEYKKHNDIINKSVLHLTNKRIEQDVINKNNSSLFYYCFYSSPQVASFKGIGKTIRDFLNILNCHKSDIPNNIKNELQDKGIINLLKRVKEENTAFLNMEKYFDIKIDNDNIIVITSDATFEFK